MTGETIRDLLEPVIGKSGAVYLAVSNIGQVGLAINEDSKLTGVEVRPDGLVRLERETGWTVIGPSEVVAVAWRSDTERSGPVSLSRLDLRQAAAAHGRIGDSALPAYQRALGTLARSQMRCRDPRRR